MKNVKKWFLVLGMAVCMILVAVVPVYAADMNFTADSSAYAAGRSVKVTDSAYGANGSDQEDDTKAIQAALDLRKDGKDTSILTVVIPAGTYYISGQLRIYSNTTLKLDTDAVIVRSDDTKRMLANGNADSDVGGYNQLTNVTITGGTWDGNNQDSDHAVNLMYFWHGKNIRISDTTIKEVCGSHFIELAAVSDVKIENVTFQDFVYYTGDGYQYDYSSVSGDSGENEEEPLDKIVSIRSEAIQLEFPGEANSTSALPYDDTPCHGITVTGCTFQNCLSGVGNHHPEIASSDITITNNTFKNMGACCINLPNMSGVTVSGNTADNVRAFLRATDGANVEITENIVTYGFKSIDSKIEQDAFYIDHSTVKMDHNKVYGCGKRAVYDAGGSTITMTDNLFDLSSIRAANRNAVQLGGQMGSKVTIDGNTVKKPDQVGIWISDSSGSVTNNTISDSVSAEGGHGIRIASGQKLNISDNKITNVASTGIRLVDCKTNITVSGNTITKPGSQGISAENSVLTADNNTITSAGSNGIIATAGSALSAANNTITSSGGAGINANASSLTASGNTITGSKSNAISLNAATSGSIKNNIIKNGNASGIRLLDCKTAVTVSGNKITKPGTQGISAENSSLTASSNTITQPGTQGISVGKSSLTASGNTITSAGSNGIIATSGSKLSASNNTITASGGNGISVSDSSLTASGNTISDSVSNAVSLTAATSGSIKDNIIKNGKASGIRLLNCTAKTVTVSGNKITKPGAQGISAENASLTVSSNTITSPGGNGMSLTDISGNITKNQISDAVKQGISINKSTGLTLSENTISGSAKHGIYMESSTATLSNNTISGSTQNGIRIAVGSNATVTGNKISDSTAQGLGVESSKVNASKNVISGSAVYGIYLNGASFTVTENTIQDSGTYSIRIADNAGASSGSVTENVLGAQQLSNKSTGKVTVENNCPFVDSPVLSAVSNSEKGVKITWKGVTGAVKYRVFYKTGSGSWTKAGDTASTSYTWTGAKSGTAYSFTVRCMNHAGTLYASNYDTVGKKITYTPSAQLATPKLSGVENVSGGIKVSWGKVAGAAKYRVYYKTTGSWTKLADTASTSYTWTGAKNGTKYTFTVRCISADGKNTTSGYDNTGKSITYTAPSAQLATPKLSGVENVSGGIKVSWGKVTGAAKYRIYYKTTGSWTKLADTASTSYTWTGAKNGTKYTFTVRCISADGKNTTSGYDNTGKSITYTAASAQLATPKLSGVENVSGGIKVSWGKVTGAAKYRVYYKTTGSWTKLADTASTSYTWTGAKSGTKYTFTVRCISADGKSSTSGYDNTGKSITYTAASAQLATPKLSGVENVSGGIKVSWGKVTGAAKYRVYYKTTGSWTKLADTTSTSYTWTGAKSGTKYTFTVRCISADGKNTTSGYDNTGKSITYTAASAQLATPKLSGAEKVSGGIKVSWGKVTGAAKYRVYYKTTGSWTKLADTASTSYTWTGAKSGTKYTFTVRCISADGKSSTSGYDNTGKSITYTAASAQLATPKLSGVEKVSGGIKVSWGKVTGAAKYRVYYKTTGSWTKLADTASTSYTWTGAKSGTKYTFTVRCISADGKSSTSGYDNTGKSITY